MISFISSLLTCMPKLKASGFYTFVWTKRYENQACRRLYPFARCNCKWWKRRQHWSNVHTSSFVYWKPKHMREYAQDALTYILKYGWPNLFTTYDPDWLEIKDLLSAGQSSHHKYDFIARIFKQKPKKPMDLIKINRIYGEVQYWMFSIQWQKRGLLHAQNLI